MSWDAYVDLLTAEGICEWGAVLDCNTAQVWAASKGFSLSRYNFTIETETGSKEQVTVDEASTLLELIKNYEEIPGREGRGQSRVASPAGVRVNNQKYFFVGYNREDPKNPAGSAVYLKREKGGLCIVRTNKCIVIGSWNSQLKQANGKEQNPAECNCRVEGVGKSLLDNNY
eukprot:TRINITY_DN1124_c0_g1_i3.p2 TRINITY_DN1124_c0_g1~~TRINITY_DN1124_c0_g1_i3.p2  ORF type:complete len:172 (-),score=39.85 TRINITY_DN1124_c0_g1_i3:174-689(-)